MTTRVVHCKKEPYDILIDRTTKWGNPFKINKDGYNNAGQKWTREEVIELYRSWMETMETGDDGLMNDLHELKDKVLGCWCKPLPCHGDILAELADRVEVL